ncbi:hypothetical protein LHYA1_G004828 [Lachnellula hyalina]|uniref:SET domain-containing protein n=1 Tax=Lachnellula hyalina TaxID=1316788 RepID=A0A8H8R4T7_9HELO|nr:uncharacterized protein LHYA1_G004828 [Lachnellula hyalina]TVY26884.1 hypothetical protein LHYA1_G004828 [Lachnellula hyalina]
MHFIPQTPVYEDANSSSDASTIYSSHSSPVSSHQNGAISESGLGPPIWSNGEDAVKLSNATSKKAVASETSLAALPSPPLSDCELETEIADAVLEAPITVNPAKSNLETDKKLAKRLNLDADWMGTSQVYATQAAYTQASNWRKALLDDLTRSPYDPSIYVDLSSVDCKLGYTDICVANAYRALLLVQAGSDTAQITSLPSLANDVRTAIQFRLRTASSLIIAEELKEIRLQASQLLLDGLKGCSASWDGLQEAKKALKEFPGDPELLELKKELLEDFKTAHQELVAAGCKPKNVRELTRSGKIFQKRYPWVDESLFWRTPALVRDVNKEFGENAQVRSVVWGPEGISPTKRVKREGEDVGPLGIFATRDIKEDEVILVDRTLLGISDARSNQLDWCDGCNASLRMPYLNPKDVHHPDCCKSVAYCSQECHNNAIDGYHSLLCGKEFDWVYTSSLIGALGENGEYGSRWRPIMFKRLIAIVLSDMKSSSSAITHPLQHPLVARMAANYPHPDILTPESAHHWQFFENVVAPTQILLQLGIDVFSSQIFTQEVIQTIYWRVENNANMASTELTYSTPAGPVQGEKVNQVNVNPNYLFFNHSCMPNVTWHGGAVPDSNATEISWLRTGTAEGEVEKPGSSSVICIADRDIKKGEELKISYVGDPLGLGEEGGYWEGVSRAGKREWMLKWFDDGCGCEVCEKENEDARKKAVVAAAEENV